MKITSAKYNKDPSFDVNTSIEAEINDVVCHIPLDPENTDYAEIMRQVDAGELTIEEAE